MTLLQALAEHRSRAPASVNAIAFSQCRFWQFDGHRLSHETGGFFSLVLVRQSSNIVGLNDSEMLLVDQPEAGILGFLVQPCSEGYRWLVQLKQEPGNIGLTQCAPTVQATQSNFMRLHGGRSTPFLDYFTEVRPNVEWVSDSMQSEQGDRFLAKFNRNSVVRIHDNVIGEMPQDWLWINSTDLRSTLLIDYALNTDARSVLACTDWGLLSERSGAPFEGSRCENEFGQMLRASYQSRVDDEGLSALHRLLDDVRAETRQTLIPISFTDARSFTFREDGIYELVDNRPRARFFESFLPRREVTHWWQPLLISSERQEVVLLCSDFSGVAKFLVRPYSEPGFTGGPQFGPSVQTGSIGDKDDVRIVADLLIQHPPIASVWQSDEGGRFFRSICRYSIVQVDHTRPLPVRHPHQAWLTLAELKALMRVPGTLTNELRNALSLLLTWA